MADNITISKFNDLPTDLVTLYRKQILIKSSSGDDLPVRQCSPKAETRWKVAPLPSYHKNLLNFKIFSWDFDHNPQSQDLLNFKIFSWDFECQHGSQECLGNLLEVQKTSH